MGCHEETRPHGMSDAVLGIAKQWAIFSQLLNARKTVILRPAIRWAEEKKHSMDTFIVCVCDAIKK